jgi:hypothetical protein
MTEEIAVLASMKCGVRLRSGSMTRRFALGDDPKGRPVNLGDRTKPRLTTLNRRLVLPTVTREYSIMPVEQMKSFSSLSPQSGDRSCSSLLSGCAVAFGVGAELVLVDVGVFSRDVGESLAFCERFATRAPKGTRDSLLYLVRPTISLVSLFAKMVRSHCPNYIPARSMVFGELKARGASLELGSLSSNRLVGK